MTLPIVPLFIRKFFARAFNNGEAQDATWYASEDTQNADLVLGHNQVRARLNAISTAAGSLRYSLVSRNTFVATASQTAFTVTTYDSTVGASFVLAFSNGASGSVQSMIAPSGITQSSNTVVTLPAQTVNAAVTICIFAAGNGTSQLASLTTGQGAGLVGYANTTGLGSAADVENALDEIYTDLNSSSFLGGILGISAYIKKDGTVAFTGNQSMGSHKITNLSAGSASSNDAARMNDITPAALQSALGTYLNSTYVPLAGNVTMTGPLDFGSAVRITNLPQAIASGQPLTYDQLPTVNAFRNAIINGGAIIANGSDYVSTVSGTYDYGKSELCKGALTGTTVGGTLTQNSSSNAGRTGYSILWSNVTTTGSGIATWRFFIEAKDAVRFKNQTATASCVARHNIGSAIAVSINVYKPTVADNFAALTTLSTGSTISVASDTSTAVYNRSVSMGDCSNGVLVEVSAAIGAVTAKNIEVTEVQFEAASVETAFEHENAEVTLSKCQRYFTRFSHEGSQRVGYGNSNGADSINVLIPFRGSMRAAPTLVVSSAAHFTATDYAIATTFLVNSVTGLTSITLQLGTTHSGLLLVSKVANFNSGSVAYLTISNASGTLDFTARF